MSEPMDEDLFHSMAGLPATEEEVAQYQEPEPEHLQPPPDFRPFFTVIEDPESGDHYHPSVHYVFADDDQDILTDAALTAIDQPAGSTSEIEERIIVVDMAADGKSITSAKSLSQKWQNLTAAIAQAPSWDDTTGGTEKVLMLKISGAEHKDDNAEKPKHVYYVDELVRSFGESIDWLEGIIGVREETSEQE